MTCSDVARNRPCVRHLCMRLRAYSGVMDNLQGKVALVTGSSRGIGRAIAVALARAGADLAINYRTRAADAKDAESEIAGYGRRCAAIQADVSLRSGVD